MGHSFGYASGVVLGFVGIVLVAGTAALAALIGLGLALGVVAGVATRVGQLVLQAL